MSLCEVLTSRGIKLKAVGSELRLSPTKKVTPEIVLFATEHKGEIMAELKGLAYYNPYPQNTPAARQESLIQVMDAIHHEAAKKAKEAYESGELTDRRIETVRQSVLNGKAKLKDFQVIVDKAYLN